MLFSFLRRFKPAFVVFNFFNYRKLKHLEKLYAKNGLTKAYFSPVSSTDFNHLKGEVPWLDKKESALVLPKENIFQQLDKRWHKPLQGWSKNGYAILPQFFSGEEVDLINNTIDNLVENGKAKWQYKTKIMFAIEQSKYLKGIGNNTELLRILELLLGRKVTLFQSINFLIGSEQRTHSDTVHMTTFPLGYMAAIWIALEDITLENGPLHYYPGSHKLPYVLNPDFSHGERLWWLGKNLNKSYEERIRQILQENQLKKSVFCAKKGDLFIWHANLLHGGEEHLNKALTRKSMVFHYFGNDVICYHEISQRPSLRQKR